MNTVGEEMPDILAAALEHLRRSQGDQSRHVVAPSMLWQGLFSEIDAKVLLRSDDQNPLSVLSGITRFGCYTLPRRTGTPECRYVTNLYLRWLQLAGRPLSSFSEEMRESRFIDPDLGFEVDHRYVSTMFLLHLCMFVRLENVIGVAATILEIGAGYGGLARLVKLRRPLSTYVIVDLPKSLFFSFLFLKSNFPDAKTLYVRSDHELKAWVKNKDRYDFIFVPASLAQQLSGQMFDVVINTMSFGEMPQESVDFFMDLVQSKLEVRYLYSINRFGKRPGGDPPYKATRSTGDDSAHTCLKLDANWDVLLWDAWGGASFSEIELGAAPYLEVLLRRKDWLGEDVELRRNKAYWLYHAAKQCLDRHSDWTYYLWDSVRLYPLEEPVRLLVEHMTRMDWPERRYYEKLAAVAEKWVPNNLPPHASIGAPPYPARPASVPGEVRFQIEAGRKESERRDAALIEAMAERSKLEKSLTELSAQRELELAEMHTRGKVIEALTQKIADLEKAKTAPDA